MIRAGSLNGLDVLITRDKLQSKEMKKMVENMGGTPHVIPLLDYRYYHDANESDYLKELHTYDWIIFTSQNAVKFYFCLLKKEGISPDTFNNRYGVVGTTTKKTLESYGKQASFVPNVFTGKQLAKELLQLDSTTKKTLLPKGNLAKNDATSQLQNSGWTCDDWVIYETYLPDESRSFLSQMLSNQKLDVLTFTSSSAVHHFMKVVKEDQLESKVLDKVIATIGPVTKQTAENYGLDVHVCPTIFTMEKMMEELSIYLNRRK
jgi:uroporphyrinogen-III synthase